MHTCGRCGVCRGWSVGPTHDRTALVLSCQTVLHCPPLATPRSPIHHPLQPSSTKTINNTVHKYTDAHIKFNVQKKLYKLLCFYTCVLRTLRASLVPYCNHKFLIKLEQHGNENSCDRDFYNLKILLNLFICGSDKIKVSRVLFTSDFPHFKFNKLQGNQELDEAAHYYLTYGQKQWPC